MKQEERFICIFLAIFSVDHQYKLPGCFVHCFLSQTDSINKHWISSQVIFPSKSKKKNVMLSVLTAYKAKLPPYFTSAEMLSTVDTLH